MHNNLVFIINRTTLKIFKFRFLETFLAISPHLSEQNLAISNKKTDSL